MNTRQINYWTIGGFDGALPVRKAIDEAKAMGLDGIELVFGAGELSYGISDTECISIREYAEKRSMSLATLASGSYWTCSLAHPDIAVREQAVSFTKDYIRAAHHLGARSVLVIPGHTAVPWDASVPRVSYADAWARVSDCVRACLPVAEKLGVCIALENVWNRFLTDPMAMRMFIDQFESPFVGNYLDTANMLISGAPEDWITVLGPRVKAVHVKNFTGSDAGGGLHGFGEDMMTGDVDWGRVFDALRSINYEGPLTAEMIPFSRLPDIALPDMELARRTARSLLALTEERAVLRSSPE